MIKTLINEYELYSKKNKKFKLIRAVWCYYTYLNFRVVFLIRLMQNTKFNFFKRLIQKKLKLKYSVDVGINTIIGKAFWVEHFMGIVLGDGVRIGDNCTVYHGVTIGQKNGKYPCLGDNVTVYPDVQILGDVRIGNNTIISSNATVLKSTNDNSFIVGSMAFEKRRD